jgi:hypothetical protein
MQHNTSSSTDAASVVVLRPGDTLHLTYEAGFDALWDSANARWRDAITNGTVRATFECGQQTLTPHPAAANGERLYLEVSSGALQSDNTVPLTWKP